MTASIALENAGKSGIRVLASMYEITGTAVYVDPGTGALGGLDESRWQDAVSHNDGPAARYGARAQYGQAELIQFGPVAWESAWLEPGESTRATVVAFAPAGRYDLLRLTTDVAAAPADRVPVSGGVRQMMPAEQCGGATVLATRLPLERRSALEWLTTSDQESVTAWVRDGAAESSRWWADHPGLVVQLQHRGLPCAHLFDEGDAGLEDRAKLAWSGAVTDALPPSAKKPE